MPETVETIRAFREATFGPDANRTPCQIVARALAEYAELMRALEEFPPCPDAQIAAECADVMIVLCGLGLGADVPIVRRHGDGAARDFRHDVGRGLTAAGRLYATFSRKMTGPPYPDPDVYVHFGVWLAALAEICRLEGKRVLWEAVEDKMAVNRLRVWGRDPKTGLTHHVACCMWHHTNPDRGEAQRREFPCSTSPHPHNRHA